MNTSTPSTPRSPLDHPPGHFARRPLFAETLTLLRSVRDHDLESLAWMSDDDFGIVDVDPAGRTRVVRTRDDWQLWFHQLLSTLDDLDATTDSEIISYKAVREQSLGYSVVEFRQTITIGSHTARFDWKQTNRDWREARWHGSVVASDVPDELRRLTERSM